MRLVFAIMLTATVSSAVVVSLQPGSEGKDAMVTSPNPGDNYGSLPYFGIGRDASGYGRSLIEWDLSSIPANQDIVEASMELYCVSITASITTPITFFMIEESWGESTVTWSNQPDYNGSIFTQVDWPSNSNIWLSIDLTDMVSDWNDGIYDNYGIIGIQEGEMAVASFSSSDDTTPSHRPTLIVEYVEVGVEASTLGQIKACYK